MNRRARNLPPPGWLRAFEAAARHVSFVAAGQELGVTAAAVSQQVRLLEQELGVALFRRLARGLMLTEAGTAYLPVVRDAFERLASGTADLFRPRGRDRLVLRAAIGFSHFWLLPRLMGFRQKHPTIELQILTSIWPEIGPDPSADLEIRVGHGDWPGLEAIRLSWDRVFPVCAPSRRPMRRNAAQPKMLVGQNLIHLLGFQEGWPQWLEAAGLVDKIDANAGIAVDSAIAAYDLAEAGAGLALGRSCLVEPLLVSRRLAAPFRHRIESRDAFYLVYRSGVGRGKEAPAARAFRDWIAAEAKAARRVV